MKKIFKYKKILVSACLLTFLAVGVTIAYYLTNVQDLSNTFQLKTFESTIEEPDVDINGSIIEKAPYVKLSDDSTGDAIVRVRLVISPEDTLTVGNNSDCNIVINENWYEGEDGYYYYRGILDQNHRETKPLFTEITGVVETREDGNHYFINDIDGFEVSIYQETVQASMGDLKFDSGYKDDIAKQIWNYYDTHGNTK